MSIQKKGYWSTHEYTRHSVEADTKLAGWIGWKKFGEILAIAEQQGKLEKTLVLTAFKLGGRITEILAAHRSMFSILEDDVSGETALVVEGLPLGKRWIKTGEYLDPKGVKRLYTQKVEAFRTFGLVVSDDREPYSQEFLELIKKNSDLLFKSPYGKLDKPYSRVRAYQLINGLSKKVGLYMYPHLLRAWRASQLARDYGWKEGKLMEWFDWKDFETAHHYSKSGVFGLVSDMKRGK